MALDRDGGLPAVVDKRDDARRWWRKWWLDRCWQHRRCIGDFGAFRNFFDLGDEAIAAARESLNIARLVRGIAQGFTKLVDGSIEAMAEVHESVVGPDASTKLVARNELARAVEESYEDLERLATELEANAMAPEFTGTEVRFKGTEPDAAMIEVCHRGPDCINSADELSGGIVS